MRVYAATSAFSHDLAQQSTKIKDNDARERRRTDRLISLTVPIGGATLHKSIHPARLQQMHKGQGA